MASDTKTRRANRRAYILLSCGAAVGILLGAAGAFVPDGPDTGVLPDEVIAQVNDKTITTEDLARALQQVASENRNEITDEDRARVLNRLIDEELLVQRGVEMGLIDSDSTVREAIAEAMTRLIVAESSSKQPSEDDLRAFFEDYYGRHNVFLFEVIRNQVEAAYIQRTGDKALRDYLDWLWEEAEVTVAPEATR